jgi:ABC-type phosphate/phosphonate transport system substrate-binding protein
MKKIALSILLGFTAISSFAQSQNIFAERLEIIKKVGTSQASSIAWYSGNLGNADLKSTAENYLGLSNYLSAKTNSLIVLETLRSDKEVVEEAMAGKHEVVYASALLGSQLLNYGWKPLVGRAEPIEAVILTLKNNKKIQKESDLQTASIISAKGAITSAFTKYSLMNSYDMKKMDGNTYLTKDVSQDYLITLLDNVQVDGIVVRSVIADKFIKQSDKYNIFYKSKPSPGHMVFVSPKMSPAKAEQLKLALLSLNTMSSSSVALKAMEGHEEGKAIFKEVTSEEIKLAQEVFTKTNQEAITKTVK